MARTSLLARSPFAPSFWRSPVRGTRFTALLGVVLLGGITLLFVTGLLSYAAYNPNLAAVNDKTPDKGILGFYLFDWPTDPPWLYRLTQGVHVTLGVTLIPVLLAKLWSVVPKLFTLPPARSLTHALERLSLLLLVGGALFEFTTGVLNIQLDYVFPGSFYPLHFYGAWVFFAAFLAHAILRTPTALRNLRRMRAPSQEGGEEHGEHGKPGEGATRVARDEPDELAAPEPPTPPSPGAARSAWSVAPPCCCSRPRPAAASTVRCAAPRSSPRTAEPSRAAAPAASRSTRRPRMPASRRRRPTRRPGGWSSPGAPAPSG